MGPVLKSSQMERPLGATKSLGRSDSMLWSADWGQQMGSALISDVIMATSGISPNDSSLDAGAVRCEGRLHLSSPHAVP